MTSSSNLPKALVLQDACYGKNFSSFLDFTRNYEQTSGIFVLSVLGDLDRIPVIFFYRKIATSFLLRHDDIGAFKGMCHGEAQTSLLSYRDLLEY